MTEKVLTSCKVWNDNIYDFTDKFKEKTITIPSGKYIEMDPFEANEFVGKFYPIKVLADDTPDPKSFKKLRKEFIYTEDAVQNPTLEAKKFKCHCCSYVASNDSELEAHIKSRHADVEKPKRA